MVEPPSTVTPPAASSLQMLHNISFTYANVNHAIRRTKLTFSPGPDGLSSATYKFGGILIPSLLAHLFSISMSTGHYPDCWKTSTIRPRHKKGSHMEIHNYRPIHHTPIISRVMERVINVRLMSHLTTQTLSPSNMDSRIVAHVPPVRLRSYNPSLNLSNPVQRP